MTVHILRGDARQLPLADESVDLIVTSPPYWALRAYTDGGEAYDGQIGAEATPQEFIDNLIACTREWVRVLKPSGSIFVNLGDKYAMDDKWGGRSGPKNHASNHHVKRRTGIRSKSLVGLPWRYALACIDTTRGVPVDVVRQILDDVEAGLMTYAEARSLVADYDFGGGSAGLGLILRAEIIWSKLNGLPESVTDRTRRSHEYVFHLVKQPRYYAAIDHIRQPHNPATISRNRYDRADRYTAAADTGIVNNRSDGGLRTVNKAGEANPLGALPGSVWDLPTEPLRVPEHLPQHFAAMPTALVRPLVLGWSPAGICTACGEGRRPLTADRGLVPVSWGADRVARTTGSYDNSQRHGTQGSTLGHQRRREITGEVCGCPDTTAPTQPSIVLDPFGGTGTVALVASALGRDAISNDMSADYCRLATWRTQDPGQIAKVLGVNKPPVQLAGQTDLLTELDGGAA